MSTQSKILGAQLKQLSDNLLGLLLKAPDTTQKKELRDQLRKVHQQTARLVEANVDTATDQYREATALLGQSNEVINEACKDLSKVSKAINKIAKVIGRVEKLISKLT